jgi:hypothetical protein
MFYRVTKIDSTTGNEIEYGGGYTADDVKAITKGYAQDKTIKDFYNRAGSRYFYIVEQEA